MTTTILVQDIETFETIITLPNMHAFDEWMDDSSEYGIVSLDTDPDGEHAFVALVASDAGPDYDVVTNEPVVPAAAELEAKLDIAMEIDMEETITTPAPKKPRKSRKSKTPKSNTLNKGKTMKNHEILAAFISANPGVTRAVVFDDAGLQGSLRSPAQVTAIAAGDKLETKRWNSCINRFIRKIRRDGTDIQVVGQGKTATYTIGSPDGQLVLPFDEAAEAHNATIIGNDSDEVVEDTPKVDPKRAEEAPNQSLSFESLLAQLDDEAATVTSDDQEAFEAAQKMIK